MSGNQFGSRQAHTYEVIALQSGMYALLCLFRCEPVSRGTEFADCLSHTLEIIAMARGKGGNTSKDVKQTAWTTFVDIPVTGVSEADIDDRYGTYDAFADDVASLLASGYRIGVSYNEGNSAFVVSVTCRDDSSPNAGCTFTAFAGEWYQALRVAMYKHYVIAGEVWVREGGKPSPARFG